MLQAVSFQDELLPFLNAVLVAEDKKWKNLVGYSQTVCFKQMKTDNNEFDPPRSKAKLIYQKQFPRTQEFLK